MINKKYLKKELADFKTICLLLLKGKGSLSDYLLIGFYCTAGFTLGYIL